MQVAAPVALRRSVHSTPATFRRALRTQPSLVETSIGSTVSAAAAALALALLCPELGLATTWAPYEVTDPITKDLVNAAQPVSSGSYIYHWPEKVDQVFWPYTDDHWLWFSPSSGYIAFGDDFEKLESNEIEGLGAWLATHYDPKAPPDSRLRRLLWAEKVYGARGMDDDFWCHFYRLMAFETRDDRETSLAYVRKAIPLLLEKLDSSDEPGARLEGLYLLSEYNRRLGNDVEARSYFERLSAFEVDEELAGYKRYVLAIAEEQRSPRLESAEP